MNEINGEKAYTTKEAAAILNKTVPVIRKYAREGRLKAETMSNRKYIPESSLRAFAQKAGE